MKQLISLPYHKNSANLFAHFADYNWSIFLDSGYPSKNAGRYDILSAEPIATIVTQSNVTTINHPSKKQTTTLSPFIILREILEEYTLKEAQNNKLPFNGGALGYFSYDLARTIEKIPKTATDEEHLPEMAIGIYTWAIVVDHKLKKSYFTGEVLKKSPLLTLKRLIDIFNTPENHIQPGEAFHVTSKISSNFSYKEYRSAFNKIKEYIVAGDCYQINLTQRFSATANGSTWIAYQQLRKLNPAPFSAYINTPFGEILSSSPERFLKVNNNKVETKPIKGTRPRSNNKIEDNKQLEALHQSPKDRAENVMIVDLLRNDLGRVCKTGSVKAPRLFDIESYATVHHLVSTIHGTLATEKDSIHLLEACFPGGSITGAPKIRAMEIIESLEPHRRGLYCGSIGYIDFNGNMDINIAIRTLVYNQNTIRYWVGGGIVHDSDIDEEYQEALDKGKALLELLNNCRSDKSSRNS
ncbi:MAG TPA: aminodeoxychorismate synthase component I [Leucothrix mucor]|nr:aminodeoxychorismate synthase component I [Leucothrix mucor]